MAQKKGTGEEGGRSNREKIQSIARWRRKSFEKTRRISMENREKNRGRGHRQQEETPKTTEKKLFVTGGEQGPALCKQKAAEHRETTSEGEAAKEKKKLG